MAPVLLSVSIQPSSSSDSSLYPWLGYYVRDEDDFDGHPSWRHAAKRGFQIVNVANANYALANCWVVQHTTSGSKWQADTVLNAPGARLPCGASVTDGLSCEVVGCCICFDEAAIACCSNGEHALCRGCFVNYSREWLAIGHPLIKQARGGELPCVCYPQSVGGCTTNFDSQAVARLLSSQDYAEFEKQRCETMRQRVFVSMNEHLMSTVRLMATQLNQSVHGISKELLAQQLRASIPGARMCGRCRFGPIEHFACADLSAHRHEAFTGNACPKCGWFANKIEEWPFWDGNVPESAVDSAMFDAQLAEVGLLPGQPPRAPPTRALPLPTRTLPRASSSDDLALAQRIQDEERRRLRQIEQDHAMALQMERERAVH